MNIYSLMNDFKTSLKTSIKPLIGAIPMILGIVMLISLISISLPSKIYMSIFTGKTGIDAFISATFGSILAGNPVTSYIIGGELLNLGISMIVIISFIVAWVTVGLVQLPAEVIMLGKRFTIWRNILSFIFSVLVAISSVYLARLFI